MTQLSAEKKQTKLEDIGMVGVRCIEHTTQDDMHRGARIKVHVTRFIYLDHPELVGGSFQIRTRNPSPFKREKVYLLQLTEATPKTPKDPEPSEPVAPKTPKEGAGDVPTA